MGRWPDRYQLVLAASLGGLLAAAAVWVLASNGAPDAATFVIAILLDVFGGCVTVYRLYQYRTGAIDRQRWTEYWFTILALCFMGTLGVVILGSYTAHQ
jgi:hypothetical protein